MTSIQGHIFISVYLDYYWSLAYQFLTISGNLRLCYIFIPYCTVLLYIVGPLSKLTDTSLFCWRNEVWIAIFAYMNIFDMRTMILCHRNEKKINQVCFVESSFGQKVRTTFPCNFEESPYIAAGVFSPLLIYENVDIVHVFIEIYRIRY
jgi:hypothetical protein